MNQKGKCHIKLIMEDSNAKIEGKNKGNFSVRNREYRRVRNERQTAYAECVQMHIMIFL